MAGSLDVIENGCVSGWVFDPARPDARLDVKVMVGTRCLVSQEASVHRDHLAAAGYGDGKHAFVFYLSEEDWALLRQQRKIVSVVASHPDTGVVIGLNVSNRAQKFLMAQQARSAFLTAPTPNVQLTAVCIIKNEAHYVEEWIAYHLAQGVQFFLFYDNGSTDDLAGVLAPYVQRGTARIVPWPNFVDDPEVRKQAWHEQNASIAHALRVLAGVSAWVIILDVDEFIATGAGRSIPALLHGFSERDVLTLFWRFYGSSGRETAQPGLVIETFDHRRADGDIRGSPYKFMARPESVGAVQNTHTPIMANDGAVGASIGGERFWTAARGCELADFAAIWINHYHVKSREEYKAKVVRGWPENTQGKNVNWEAFFKMHDNNEVHDTSMARHGAQVREIMAGMRLSPMRPTPPPFHNPEMLARINIEVKDDVVLISGFAIDLARPAERVLLRIEDIFGWVVREQICDLPDNSGLTNGFGDGRYCFASSVKRTDLSFGQVRVRLNDALYCRSAYDPAAPAGTKP